MGAETRVYVKVEKIHTEWIELSSMNTIDAMKEAKCLPDVHGVVSAQYDCPEELKEDW